MLTGSAFSDSVNPLDTFIPINKIDPIYYDGRTYDLAADVPAAEKPYAVLAQAMSKLHCCGVATVVLHGKEQLLLIRPIGPVADGSLAGLLALGVSKQGGKIVSVGAPRGEYAA